jgi:hypothetical protein
MKDICSCHSRDGVSMIFLCFCYYYYIKLQTIKCFLAANDINHSEIKYCSFNWVLCVILIYSNSFIALDSSSDSLTVLKQCKIMSCYGNVEIN